MLENILFYILSLFLLIGSIGMIRAKQSVFSAISFFLAMLSLAGLFALLNQTFLFLAQILVSVGAIITLTLLVMVSINMQTHNLPKDRVSYKEFSLLMILILPIIALIINAISSLDLEFKDIDESFGTIKGIGQTLFDSWVLPFEIVSILLLTAMIGGLVIARRRFKHES